MEKTVDSHKDYEWFWQKLEKYLNAQNLKQTSQRRTIVEYFLKLNTHIDAEMLHAKIKQDHPNIGLATIYRTLNLLKAAALIEEQSFSDGRAVFEVYHPDTHHDHLVCILCGKIVEFEHKEIESLQKIVAAENGFQLLSHRLDLYGHCSKCR